MGDALQSIFGGSSTSSTPSNYAPQTVQDLQTALSKALQSVIGGGSVGGTNLTSGPSASQISSLGTPQVAPLTSTQTADLASTNATANNPLAQQVVNNTLSGSYLPGGSNFDQTGLTNAINAAQTTTLQGLQQTLSKSLPSQFAQSGQTSASGGSSAFDQAAALATGQTANALGNIASQITLPVEQQQLQAQQNAVGLNQNQVTSAINNLSAQALPQMISQAGLTAGTQQYQQNINNLLTALGLAPGTGSLTNIASQQTGTGSTGIVPDLTSPLKLTGSLNA